MIRKILTAIAVLFALFCLMYFVFSLTVMVLQMINNNL